MLALIKKYKIEIVLWLLILVYIAYFSYFTILRYRTLYASYFDLGIMHQTVYNTYKGLTTGDFSRILELTNPFGPEQIKRMSIHNDIILALLSLFYFIYPGPEILLIIQTIVIAIGALAVFGIAQKVFSKFKHHSFLALIFSLSYLFYVPMQRANIYEFHAVTLSTSFLLFMFYFWLTKRYRWSFVFFFLSLLSKEQVALTTTFFGFYIVFKQIRKSKLDFPKFKSAIFPLVIIVISIVWFILSILVIIPYFRGTKHFALSYYDDFGDSPFQIIIGILSSPQSGIRYLLSNDALRYFFFLLFPLGFLSLLSPAFLAIATSEFAINLFSNNPNMQNIIFHYTSVIQSFIFIAAIFGTKKLIEYFEKDCRKSNIVYIISFIIFSCTLITSYIKGPLPYSREKEIHPFKYPQQESKDVLDWSKKLVDDNIKISSTGQLAPFFTSRRYFYTFSKYYYKADYVVIRLNEIYNYPEKDELIPIYERLKADSNYQPIEQKENFEVYKKIGK